MANIRGTLLFSKFMAVLFSTVYLSLQHLTITYVPRFCDPLLSWYFVILDISTCEGHQHGMQSLDKAFYVKICM